MISVYRNVYRSVENIECACIIREIIIYNIQHHIYILNRYIFFSIGFSLLVMAELLVRYSGISITNFYIYLLTPFISMPIIYFILLKNFKNELT